jgi:hypothetical protein
MASIGAPAVTSMATKARWMYVVTASRTTPAAIDTSSVFHSPRWTP